MNHTRYASLQPGQEMIGYVSQTSWFLDCQSTFFG
jgi:hypothetical protein